MNLRRNMKKKTIVFFEDLVVCIGLFVVIIVLVLLTGCCPARVTSKNTSYDSVYVKTVYKQEIVKDTIPYYLPMDYKEVKLPDTLSYLENKWAYSEAVVSDGFLTHSLGTKDVPHDIVVDKIIEYRDTTIVKEVIKEVEKEVKVIVEVEKPDTWLETTQKNGFWVMLAIAIILILYNVFKKKINLASSKITVKLKKQLFMV